MNVKIYINDEEASIDKPIKKAKTITDFSLPIKSNPEPFRFVYIDPANTFEYNPVRFSVRTIRCLNKAGIKTYHDLTSYTPSQLLRLKFFGRKSLTEVEAHLAIFGLALKKNQ